MFTPVFWTELESKCFCFIYLWILLVKVVSKTSCRPISRYSNIFGKEKINIEVNNEVLVPNKIYFFWLAPLI